MRRTNNTSQSFFNTAFRAANLAMVLLLVTASLQAQTTTAEPTAPTQNFEIQAQPLTTALDALSRETGLSIAYSASQLEGIRSPGVRGTYTTMDALLEILAGTGVVHSFTGPTSVALQRIGDPEGQSSTSSDASDPAEPLLVAPLTIRGELLERDIQNSQTRVVISTGEELLERGET
ncbi:MAG: STN domain-containing protein, partial [Pseudomonadota bacterium]